MEVVTIDGVEYLKAAQAAKRFKYTSDYIGQLCRGKKIDAKLVGRTWYVNPLSLETHKGGLYTKSVETKTAEISIQNKDNLKTSRIDVEPVIRKETVKLTPGVLSKSNFSRRIDWKPVKYESDTSELLPNLKSTKIIEETAKLKVDIADSEKVTIKNNNHTTQMVADPLPTISLKGSLKIQSINDDFKGVEFDNRLENIVKSEEEVDREIDLKVEFKKSEENEKVKIHQPTAVKRIQKNPVREITESEATYQVDINHSAFTPQTVSAKNRVVRKTGDLVDTQKKSGGFLPYLLVVFFGLVTLGAVLFVEVSVFANAKTQDFSFNFSKIEL